MLAFSTFKILPRIGKIAWNSRLRPDLADPPAESPSTMKSSVSAGLLEEQSASFLEDWKFQARFLTSARFTSYTSLGSQNPFFSTRLAICGFSVIQKGIAEEAVGNLNYFIPQFGLGLSFKLRVWMLNRDNCSQTFTNIFPC